MSWSVTINNLPLFEGFDVPTVEQMLTQHPKYPADMQLALDTARKAGLASCTLTGARTVSPYNNDEVVDISIRGMTSATDFNQAIKTVIAAGPVGGCDHVWAPGVAKVRSTWDGSEHSYQICQKCGVRQEV